MQSLDSKPNLFIVGAMKSGTTSLHEYLDLHPDICMSDEKEPGYFVPELNRGRTESEYLGLFEKGRGLRFRGESSTHYAKLPTYAGVPERIRHFAPDARIIYIMRHPVERTISHYWHAVRDVHLSHEHRDIVRAIRANTVYTDYSYYAMQLRAYFSVFPSENIYCLTLESLLADSTSQLAALFSWLGLPEHNITELRAHNSAPDISKKVAGVGLLNRIRYSTWWAPLSNLVPAPLRHAATRLAYDEVQPRLLEAERHEVVQILNRKFAYAERLQELKDLLHRDLIEWEN
jgi:hypothetical protein